MYDSQTIFFFFKLSLVTYFPSFYFLFEFLDLPRDKVVIYTTAETKSTALGTVEIVFKTYLKGSFSFYSKFYCDHKRRLKAYHGHSETCDKYRDPHFRELL